MNGPEHYREAERLLGVGCDPEDDPGEGPAVDSALAAAQVHAILALAAATAYPAVRDYWGEEDDTDREWAGVAS